MNELMFDAYNVYGAHLENKQDTVLDSNLIR